MQCRDMLLFIDIETKANPQALELLPEPTAPKNYKDPTKIEEYLAAKKTSQREQGALDPDLAQVVALGYCLGTQGEVYGSVAGDPDAPTERDLLELFWKMLYAAGGRTCGYNIIAFDLPFLLRRSFDLGVKPNFQLDLRRFNNSQAVDLFLLLFGGPESGKSLKWVARRYGLTNRCPHLDGGMVDDMPTDVLHEYVKNDVFLAVQLFERMQGFYL